MFRMRMESRGVLNYHNGMLTVMKGFFGGTVCGADSGWQTEMANSGWKV